jgi:hypothetical protein
MTEIRCEDCKFIVGHLIKSAHGADQEMLIQQRRAGKRDQGKASKTHQRPPLSQRGAL